MKNKVIILVCIMLLGIVLMPNTAFAWLEGWDYRVNISFNQSGSTTLTDFPHNLTLDTASLIAAGKMQSDCADIRFTNSTDDLTDFEFEAHADATYGCDTADTQLWVRLRSFPTSGIQLSVYYGNSTVTFANDTNAVYDENFKAIMHIGEGTGTTTADSTQYGKDMDTFQGTPDWSSSCAFGNCLDFDKGSSEYLTGNNVYLVDNSSYTLEAWINTDDSAIEQGIIGSNTNSEGFFHSMDKNLTNYMYDVGGWYNSLYAVPNTTWVHLATTWNGSWIFQYGNGGLTNDEWAGGGTLDMSSNLWVIGSMATGSCSNCFNGRIDEVRISNVTRSADWILKCADQDYLTVGTEENMLQDANITIYMPANTTYIARNVTYNFTVEDDSAATLTCYRELDDGGQIWVGSVANSSYDEGNLTDLGRGTHKFNVTCEDDVQNASTVAYFSIIYWNFTDERYNSPEYETNTTIFKLDVNASSFVDTIYAVLNYDGTDYTSDRATDGTFVNLTSNLTVPVITTNATNSTFFWNLTIEYINGSNVTDTTTSLNQTIWFAHWITAMTSDKTNYTEGEGITFRVNVSKIVDVATITANLTYHNANHTMDLIDDGSNYNLYEALIWAVNITAYNETQFFNATINVSYGSNDDLRNSSTSNLTVFLITLLLCGGDLSNTTTIRFSFADETNWTALNGTLDIDLYVWHAGDESFWEQYAFNFTTANETHTICIYPTWATFNVNATAQYRLDPNYPDRFYFLVNATLDNSTESVTLYLLRVNEDDNILLTVKDQNDQEVEGAIIKVQRYYVGSGEYRQVAMGRTDFSGQTMINLIMNNTWYRFIIESNNVVLREYTPIIVTTQSLILYTTETIAGEFWDYYDMVAAECTYNNATWVLRCTISDTSGLMQSVTLTVEDQGILGFTDVCEVSSTSSSATLSCNTGNWTEKVFRYVLKMDGNPVSTVLVAGFLDFTTSIPVWQLGGALTGLLIVLMMFFVGAWSPVVGITLATAGLILSWVLGIITLPYGALISIIIVAGILIWRMRK